MKAKLQKVSKLPSKYGSYFYYVFFKGEDGESYKTCLYPQYRNFKNWERVINRTGEDLWIDGLLVKQGNLIDADSEFSIQEKENTVPLFNQKESEWGQSDWNRGKAFIKEAMGRP